MANFARTGAVRGLGGQQRVRGEGVLAIPLELNQAVLELVTAKPEMYGP